MPVMGVEVPPSLIVKLANVDISFLAGFLHVGQAAGESDWLKGRIISNFESQLRQAYS